MSLEQDYQKRIHHVMQYIENNLDEKISLEDLAFVGCFSPYHFHRIFRGIVGETVMSYIRRLRLERAARSLQYSNDSITEIAFNAGYESLEAFIRGFAKEFYESPSRYRKKSKTKNLSSRIQVNNNIKEYNMDVMLKKMSVTKVAYVRHTGPYSECGPAWGKLFDWAAKNRLMENMKRKIGICYDDPEITDSKNIRYDACVEIEGDIQKDGDIRIKEIPSDMYAMTLHVGPYEDLGKTYAYICGQWAPKNYKEIQAKPSIEVYLDDPHEVSPENLRTEIYVPVK